LFREDICLDKEAFPMPAKNRSQTKKAAISKGYDSTAD